jgi:type I restriction enzyme S subunit
LNGSALKELALSVLRKVPIALPPTKAEQQAIATALSDANALTGNLEQLIAKKRNIKQGAMQRLLTASLTLSEYLNMLISQVLQDKMESAKLQSELDLLKQKLAAEEAKTMLLRKATKPRASGKRR